MKLRKPNGNGIAANNGRRKARDWYAQIANLPKAGSVATYVSRPSGSPSQEPSQRTQLGRYQLYETRQKKIKHLIGCFIRSVAEIDVGKASEIDSIASRVVSVADWVLTVQ